MSVGVLEKLRQEAAALTPDEKLSLAEYLWETLPENLEIEKDWLEEAQRRSKEIDAGTAKLTPWIELQAELKSHFENRHH
ncbi:MAG: addiction module protein [Spirochaetes bacterium]|nr:addiction module protein [Spirochaetota bacterium]